MFGSPLWNCFFQNACEATRAEAFLETIFADDLNCFRSLGAGVSDEKILDELLICQVALHAWGGASQVTFDSYKEFFHVLHRSCSLGNIFKLLGCIYD